MSQEEYVVEMRWRCTSCGHVNLGRHVVCTQCGNPMDSSERYVMPDDPSLANAVTDPRLLALAEQGPNWRCPYCGSSQRAADGSCANCGAGRVAQPRPFFQRPSPRSGNNTSSVLSSWKAKLIKHKQGILGISIILGFYAAGLVVAWPVVEEAIRDYKTAKRMDELLNGPRGPRYRDIEARVVKVRWTSKAIVSRRRLVEKEGFKEAMPKDAVGAKALGKKLHHTEKIRVGTHAETYEETVPGPPRRESYVERVPCGETCTTRPQSCRRVCTSRRNGFASCRQVCSGGGRSCSTKYCMKIRHREVPTTRRVTRTREVPTYVPKKVFQKWYRWKQWQWEQNRVVEVAGEGGEPMRWPSKEKLHLGKGCSKGEREKVEYKRTFLVQWKAKDGKLLTWNPPSEEVFQRFAMGDPWRVRVFYDGKVKPLQPLSSGQ